jgi:hypothetical protein
LHSVHFGPNLTFALYNFTLFIGDFIAGQQLPDLHLVDYTVLAEQITEFGAEQLTARFQRGNDGARQIRRKGEVRARRKLKVRLFLFLIEVHHRIQIRYSFRLLFTVLFLLIYYLYVQIFQYSSFSILFSFYFILIDKL